MSAWPVLASRIGECAKVVSAVGPAAMGCGRAQEVTAALRLLTRIMAADAGAMTQVVRQLVAADDSLQHHRRRMQSAAEAMPQGSDAWRRASAAARACAESSLHGASGRTGAHAGRREASAGRWLVRRVCALAIGCAQGHGVIAGGGIGAEGLRPDGDAEAVQRAAEGWMLASRGGPAELDPDWRDKLNGDEELVRQLISECRAQCRSVAIEAMRCLAAITSALPGPALEVLTQPLSHCVVLSRDTLRSSSMRGTSSGGGGGGSSRASASTILERTLAVQAASEAVASARDAAERQGVTGDAIVGFSARSEMSGADGMRTGGSRDREETDRQALGTSGTAGAGLLQLALALLRAGEGVVAEERAGGGGGQGSAAGGSGNRPGVIPTALVALRLCTACLSAIARSRARIPAREAFRVFDEDGSGEVDTKEFTEALGRIGASLSPDATEALVELLDRDGSGSIEIDEFVRFARGESLQELVEAAQGTGPDGSTRGGAGIRGVGAMQQQFARAVRGSINESSAKSALLGGRRMEAVVRELRGLVQMLTGRTALRRKQEERLGRACCDFAANALLAARGFSQVAGGAPLRLEARHLLEARALRVLSLAARDLTAEAEAQEDAVIGGSSAAETAAIAAGVRTDRSAPHSLRDDVLRGILRSKPLQRALIGCALEVSISGMRAKRRQRGADVAATDPGRAVELASRPAPLSELLQERGSLGVGGSGSSGQGGAARSRKRGALEAEVGVDGAGLHAAAVSLPVDFGQGVLSQCSPGQGRGLLELRTRRALGLLRLVLLSRPAGQDGGQHAAVAFAMREAARGRGSS